MRLITYPNTHLEGGRGTKHSKVYLIQTLFDECNKINIIGQMGT